MHSELVISQADRRPMYLQLMEQVRRRIAVGDWPPGHEMPSIRALAAAVQVSVITVKRAYLELERSGIIVTRQGKGSFVADSPDLRARLQRSELDEHLSAAIAVGRQLGLSSQDVESRLRELWNEPDGKDEETAMSEQVIQVDGVEKAYRFFRLSNVSLALEAGQIMGFVGPNGAGKSTTMRILMGMVEHDRGAVRVLGRPMPEEQAAAKRDVGYVSEDMRLHGSVTLAWHMQFVASIYPGWDPGVCRRCCCSASTCTRSRTSRRCRTASA